MMGLFDGVATTLQEDQWTRDHLKTLDVDTLEDFIMLLRNDDSLRVADVQANPPPSAVVHAQHNGDIDSDDEPDERE